MKRLLYLLCFLPFIAGATTSLTPSTNGYVLINRVSYLRGFVYSTYSVSGSDSLLAISMSNGGVLIPAQRYNLYLQGDASLTPFPSMAALKTWMNKNFELNTTIEVYSIIDTLTNVVRYPDSNIKYVTPYQLRDSNYISYPDTDINVASWNFVKVQISDTAAKLLRLTDTTTKAITITQLKDTATAIRAAIPSLTGYVPTSTILGINGVNYDLSTNRSWSVGTVTSVATGYGLLGGTITGTGTAYSDSNYNTSRGRSQKLIDSLAAYNASHFGTGTVTSVGSGWGTTFAAITGTGNVVVDSASVATLARVQKKIDSLNAIIATKGSGTVTSVTGGRGITGGTSSTTWTGGLDTTLGYTWSTGQTLIANSLHTTPLAGITLQNLTAATAGFTNEVSNSIDLKAGYYTGGVAHTSTIRIFNNPNSSSSTGEFSLWSSIDGGAFSRFAYIGAAGNFSLSGGTFGGAVTCNSSLTANGNVTFNLAKKLTITTGTNGCSGTATLVAGTVTVSTTCTPTAGQILLTPESAGTPCATCGNLSQGTLTGGTSFVIWSSLNTDTRLVHWTIISN